MAFHGIEAFERGKMAVDLFVACPEIVASETGRMAIGLVAMSVQARQAGSSSVESEEVGMPEN